MMLLMIAIVCIFLFGLLIYMWYEAKTLKIDRRELYLPEWPQGFDGVKVLFLSDIHSRILPQWVRDELKQEKVDLIIIGGDLTEKGVPLQKVEDHISFLTSLGLTYFVWGNHDYQVDYRELDLLLREKKVTVLDNRAVSFESGGDRLWLVGIDDVSKNRDNLHLALADVEQPGYRLLLSHNPIIVEKIKESDQIHGVLSGHTHGGQICLPFLGPITGHRNSVVSKYVSGEYYLPEGKMSLFVSKGVGTSHLPLRLLAPPELHILTLRSKSEN